MGDGPWSAMTNNAWLSAVVLCVMEGNVSGGLETLQKEHLLSGKREQCGIL